MRRWQMLGPILLTLGLLLGTTAPAAASWSADDITIEDVGGGTYITGEADALTGYTGDDTISLYAQGSVACSGIATGYSWCSITANVCKRYIKGSPSDAPIDVAITISASATDGEGATGTGTIISNGYAGADSPNKSVSASAGFPNFNTSDGPNDDVDVVTLTDTFTLSVSVIASGGAQGDAGGEGTANAQYSGIASVNFQLAP